METMHEISFRKLNDETIHLEQPAGQDQPDIIRLSPFQLKHIARQMCGLDESNAERVEELERRLSVLTAGLESLVCSTSIRSSIIDDCDIGGEIIERLDGLLNLAWEYDGGRLCSEDMERGSDKPIWGGSVGRFSNLPILERENAVASPVEVDNPNLYDLFAIEKEMQP